MKQISIQFEQVHIGNKGNNLKKTLTCAHVAASSKEIFLGDSANWKVKWKDLVTFDVRNQCVFLETDQKIFELINAESELWPTFQRFIEKQWNRLQGVERADDSMDYDLHPVARVPSKTTGRARREYGTKASRHRRILQSAAANYKIGWSDDDEEKGPSLPTPSPYRSTREEEGSYAMSSAAPASDDEKTLVMSDNDEPSSMAERLGSRKPKEPTMTKRRIVKKMVDDDSDDDGLFDEAPMTTPNTTCLVTPHAAALDDNQNEETEKREDKSQVKLSAFFSAKPSAGFFKPKPKATSTITQAVGPNTKKQGITHTPLKTDHLSWIERTPTKTKAYRTPATPEKSPSRQSPVSCKSPSRSIARHFVPPKELGPNRDSIADSDDNEGDGSHKRLRLSRRKFVNCSSMQGRSKADSVLDSAALTPRKIPFGSQSPMSASKQRSPKEVVAVAHPPSPPPTKWKGLRNLGNTCYLNSSLQLLCSVAEFCSRLVGQGGSVSKSLVTVAKELRESLSSSVNPRQLKEAIDAVTDRFSGYEQRDAHEFLSDLIDRVHDEMEETKQAAETNKENVPPNASTTVTSGKAVAALTDEFFRMDVKACLKCDSCGYTR